VTVEEEGSTCREWLRLCALAGASGIFVCGPSHAERGAEIEHPNSAGVTALLAKLGIEAKVKPGERVRLTATLRTPNGSVRLS